jgi:hypothetical protein
MVKADGASAAMVAAANEDEAIKMEMRLDRLMELANNTSSNLMTMTLCSLSFTRFMLITIILSSNHPCSYSTTCSLPTL